MKNFLFAASMAARTLPSGPGRRGVCACRCQPSISTATMVNTADFTFLLIAPPVRVSNRRIHITLAAGFPAIPIGLNLREVRSVQCCRGDMHDFAYSARLLRRHPRYTIIAVVTLALGIGVTTAMFGLLDAVFFRPLPLTEPERLVELSLQSPGSRFGTVSYQEFLDIERTASAFKDLFAIGRRGVTLNHNGETQPLLIHYVSGRYFPSLGIPMHLGRGLSEADDRPGATTPHVVINHHLWQERLGAPPDIIGRPIQLNNTAFTVVGVTARGFAGLHRMQRTDVWVTTQQAHFVVPGFREDLANRSERWFHVMGRLADGATIEQARAELDVLAVRWRAAGAREYQEASLVVRSRAEDTRKQTKTGAVLLGLIGLILLIACANVANLTLARGEGRRREIGLRVALGATRPVILRQLLL